MGSRSEDCFIPPLRGVYGGNENIAGVVPIIQEVVENKWTPSKNLQV